MDGVIGLVILLVILAAAYTYWKRHGGGHLIDLCPPGRRCPTCPAGGVCQPCPPCPSGGVCPTCPEPTPCPPSGICPPCPSCPSGGVCPPCPPPGPPPNPPKPPAQPQVFLVDTGKYGYTSAQAADVAKKFGATVATYDQLMSAYYAGAEWCHFGWVNDSGRLEPMLIVHEKSKNCGGGPGAVTWKGAPKAGVVLFGQKPASASAVPGFTVFAWNSSRWSRW